ncbi:MAG: xanthine dehydrogenase family protein subunit M [Deltaproteobacteria bacterium]|jgi:carbon-monoxide dehydrogenase medium subunit|nr:xanthine dehydrogenase family protein subunit M [Deltaproteobacteria bacterium]
MRLSHFEYRVPKTLEEAIELLESGGPDARLMAGGTDLLMKMKHGAIKPKLVISLKKIDGLDTIAFSEKTGLTIGATALLADVASHPDIIKHYPAVAEAARGTANVQVRNMGTVVGNLCNASPAADNAPTLLAMGTTVHIQGAGGKRDLPLEQFFKGPGLTALKGAEIVTALTVPLPPLNAGAAYLSLSARGKLDCTAVGVAAMVTMKKDVCDDLRLFIAACGPTPLRAPGAEEIMRGKTPADDLLERAGEQAAGEASPINDLRASADYRTRVVAVLTSRVIKEASKRALKR